MKEKIRIVFGIARLTYGGTETQLYELLRRLDRDRFDPGILTVAGGGENYDKFASLGIPIDVAGRSSKYDPGILTRCAAAIRKRRPHVLYSLLVTANFWMRPAAAMSGVPVIIAGERGVVRDRGAAAFIPEKIFAGITDLVIVNAPAVRDAYVARTGISNNKVIVIPNGVDTESFRPGLDTGYISEELGIPEGKKILGIVSRLHPMKGIEDFIDAAGEILREDGNVAAVIVGDGPLKTALERRAAAKCPHGSVIFTGYREEIPLLLNIMDVLVFPSLTEGLSNSLVEAAAAGRAIVASDIEENRYVIENGANGLLAMAGDVDSLAASMKSFLNDNEMRKRVGAAARATAESRFSYELMVRSHENRFVEIVEKKNVRERQ